MNSSSSEKWCEALLLPGESDIRQSSLRELAEYFDIGQGEAAALCESALENSKSEWEDGQRRTRAEILDFYDRTRSYIFEHVWWHATDLSGNAINVEIIDYARQQGAGAYLDFGSGVGANAILAARQGLQVTLADVSRTMLDFARWRMQRRGLAADYIYLRHQPLPRESFDFVTAMDVMEHLPRPADELRQISASLRPGGLLVFNARPGFDPLRPMHILPSLYPIRRALRASGLRLERDGAAEPIRALDCFVMRRSRDGALINLGWRCYDSLRYSALAELVSRHVSLPQRGATAPDRSPH